MEFPYSTCFGTFTLLMETGDRSLRPWDASDELILQLVHDEFPGSEKIMAVNDSCGALSVPLAERTGALISDSLCETEEILLNLKANGKALPSLGATPGKTTGEADLIVMRIPKSLDYFQFQLESLSRCIHEPVPIIAGGMSRHLPAAFFSCFEKAADQGSYSRIIKKARSYRGILTPRPTDTDGTFPFSRSKSFLFNGSEYLSLPGTFSLGRLDRGSRFLLENFPELPEPSLIVDPGCGTGILGMEALKHWPGSVLKSTDENAMAVMSAVENARLLGLQDRCEIMQNSILKGFSPESADLAVCNPPFHRGHRVSVETGFSFIRESSRVLKKGGHFLAVVNRTLGYGNVLDEMFESVRILRQNRDFTLLLCRK